MKNYFKNFENLPVNLLLFILLAVFIVQIAITMFYSNGIITFTTKYGFYSLDRAAEFADSNFSSMRFDTNYKKEMNGFLYPFLLSIIYKIAGKTNMVPIIYVFSFVAFFIITAIFFKMSSDIFGKEIALFATIVFITAAPVILSIYSGADVVMVFLLLAIDIYFLYYNIEKKDYTPAIIVSIILMICNFTSAIFGLAALTYIFCIIFSKKIKQNYYKVLIFIFLAFVIAVSVLLFFIFVPDFSFVNLQKLKIFEEKTFYVDTFFPDGFLWSKVFAPFLALFFYVGLFIKIYNEFKNKQITFNFFVLLLTISAMLIEFFSTFAHETDTLFFISPFYFVFILYACYGIMYFTDLLLKNKVANKNLLFTGLFIFIILYNIIISFNKTIEQNNNIRFIINESYVQKFLEK